MKKLLLLIVYSAFLFLINQQNILAQIQDIKKESNQNKNNNSNNSSSDDSFGESFFEGCLGSIFEGCLSSLFEGCLFSGGKNSNQNNYQNQNQNNYTNNPDSIQIVENQPIYQDTTVNQNFDDEVLKPTKEPSEFSLDIKPNFGFGFEFTSNETYKYVDYLPGLRANLAWFLIDFRYNLLTETTGSMPDAFKTWDLTFLINLKPAPEASIFFGAGMHYENYSETNFLAFHLGSKIFTGQKRDYIMLDTRFTVDFNESGNPDDNAYPFSEVSLNYHRRFLNSKNLNGYFSFGGFYHNYYHTVDIWAFQAGIVLNWHN